MKRILNLTTNKTKKNRSRFSSVEELEGRLLLAVAAGTEFSAAAAAAEISSFSEAPAVQINASAVEIGDEPEPLPTFNVTISGYSGYYDGLAHGVTLEGLQEGDIVTYSEEGVLYYTTPLTYSNAGNYSVFVNVQRAGYQAWNGSATVSLAKKQIVVSGTVVQNKVYDGTTAAEVNIGLVSGIIDSDLNNVTVGATGTFPSSAVGSYTNVKVTYSISGKNASNYVVSPSFEYKSADITATEVKKIAEAVVISDTMPTSLKLNDLPSSLKEVQVGDTVYAQIWVKNQDGSLSSCVGGYLDLVFDDTVLTAETFTVSTNFNTMSNVWSIEEGRVVAIGGMCLASEKTLGVSQWALLGTVTFTVTGAGSATIQTSTPTMNGKEMEAMNLARSGAGTFKSSDIDFRSADITATGASKKLDTPKIENTVTDKDMFISYGANRHRLQWNAVENASGYEVSYSADGVTWKTISAAGTSAVITGLKYGTIEQYKVRALGTGTYTASDWSAVKSFYVCPMDVNGDNDVAGADRSFMIYAWLAEEGDDNFIAACDINGDGDVAGADRSFLSANWLCDVTDEAETMFYPPALETVLVSADELFVSGADIVF